MIEDTHDHSACVVSAQGLSFHYGETAALTDLTLNIKKGVVTGLVGPDGVGKSSLLALIAGAHQLQSGQLQVLGGNMAASQFRTKICPRIAYMPQGLGKNLYPTLSVWENLAFFADLFGLFGTERNDRMRLLLTATGLIDFANRPVGKLSGGMKQKLGLCCALIHHPDLLILDEPTTGVDPLSRRQFWALIDHIRTKSPGMSVLVATAYMEEAAHFDELVVMYGGRLMAQATPASLLAQTHCQTLEQAFVALLPEEQRLQHCEVTIMPHTASGEIAIEACNLSMQFGQFSAVDEVNFRIYRGEIFGFLGSNGCGKTTTMKLLTGLLAASAGEALLFGKPLDPNDLTTRSRVGFMSQSFSLYSELTLRQNLALHARLFALSEDSIAERIQLMAERFDLRNILDDFPDALSLGDRQRLSLAVAMIHGPEILILDEPTSGVDPIARDAFWNELIRLSRHDGVTIFISTHFMNEAERCDRISLMHAGKVLISGSPQSIVEQSGADGLEAAFIKYLEAASEQPSTQITHSVFLPQNDGLLAMNDLNNSNHQLGFSWRRLTSFARRETLELKRDPIRLSLAALGSLLLMLVLGFGITMDVEDISYAVLDYDHSSMSRDYQLSLSGSRYFTERPALSNHDDIDKRMRSGELSLAIEIPPGFAKNWLHGKPVEVGAWIDGAMPQRAETIRGYVQAMHQYWLMERWRDSTGSSADPTLVQVVTRFRYNPDVRSLPAMVPAVIPLLLMMIPAILAALSVVREKELGSMINFYVTPATRLEFLLGKQMPYVVISMMSFALLMLMAVLLFKVNVTGSFLALLLGALLYVFSATALGLLISSFVKSQVAALFGTALLTILPTVQFSGMIDPVSSLEGVGRWIGELFPATHFIIISRGAFSKSLSFEELWPSFIPLLMSGPVLILLSALLLKKQAR